MRTILVMQLAAGALAALALPPLHAQEGKQTYEQKCAVCHAAGLAGAPRPGNAADWAPRLKAGKAAVYRNALQGTLRGMPPKGGNPDLPDAAVRAAADYMMAGAASAAKPSAQKAVAQAPAGKLPATAASAGAAAQAASAAPAPVASKAPSPAAAESAAPAPATAAATTTTATAAVALPVAAKTEPGTGAAQANAFNRLLRPPSRRNPPPMEDGIHDPAVDGTQQLQPPLAAFSALPRSNAGNRVDWVRALADGKIAPRWERDKPDAAAVVMDLNIVREVKGSMPDVVYPHKQHTEWLDCSNCHPGIFVPQKGANQMSMAAILLGQGCGACHGRVAFPVSECRLCHSKKKDGIASGAAAPQADTRR
ncbi:MAG TPA: c(7)-type cytochrome triheme domain-containing protein [Burkholderiales bacterium]